MHVADEMDRATLPRAGQDPLDRRLEALVLVGHREADALEATGAKPTQEIEPERLGLCLADIDADHLPLR